MLTITITFDDEDVAAVNHVVISHPNKQENETPGEAWLKHAVNTVGVEKAMAKVEKYRVDYLKEKEEQGKNYKTAAEKFLDSPLAVGKI